MVQHFDMECGMLEDKVICAILDLVFLLLDIVYSPPLPEKLSQLQASHPGAFHPLYTLQS